MQEGGNIASTPVGGAQEESQDPILQIAEMMAQGLQSGDCNMLSQACEAFLSLLQQVQAPQQEPLGAPASSAPVFKKGGKMIRRKCAKKQEGGEIYGKLKQNQKDKSLVVGDGAFSNIKGKKVKIKM